MTGSAQLSPREAECWAPWFLGLSISCFGWRCTTPNGIWAQSGGPSGQRTGGSSQGLCTTVCCVPILFIPRPAHGSHILVTLQWGYLWKGLESFNFKMLFGQLCALHNLYLCSTSCTGSQFASGFNLPTLWNIISLGIRIGPTLLAFERILKTWFCQWVCGKAGTEIVLITDKCDYLSHEFYDFNDFFRYAICIFLF